MFPDGRSDQKDFSSPDIPHRYRSCLPPAAALKIQDTQPVLPVLPAERYRHILRQYLQMQSDPGTDLLSAAGRNRICFLNLSILPLSQKRYHLRRVWFLLGSPAVRPRGSLHNQLLPGAFAAECPEVSGISSHAHPLWHPYNNSAYPQATHRSGEP